MKKLICVISLSLLLLLTGMHINAGQGKGVYIICKELTQKVLSDVKVSKKKLDNGLRVDIKSKNKLKIEYLLKTIQKCIDEAASIPTESPTRQNELLYLKAVKSTLTDNSGSIRLEMVSDTPEMVKIIKDVSIPRVLFRRDTNLDADESQETAADF
jgi:hypothetical protein